MLVISHSVERKKKGKRDGVPGTKNVDEVGFEPTTSCNGTHDELAKQARYHCAIRPSYLERRARHYERHHALSCEAGSHVLYVLFPPKLGRLRQVSGTEKLVSSTIFSDLRHRKCDFSGWFEESKLVTEARPNQLGTTLEGEGV